MSQSHVKSKAKSKRTSPLTIQQNGNSAVTRTAAGARLGAFYASGPVFGLGAPVQEKLVIGRANDPYEREADIVAERVIKGRPAPSVTSILEGGLNRVTQRRTDQEDEPEQTSTTPMLFRRAAYKEPPDETSPMPMLVQRQVEQDEEEIPPIPVPMSIQRQTEEDGLAETSAAPTLVQRQKTEQKALEQMPSAPLLIEGESEEEREKKPLPPTAETDDTLQHQTQDEELPEASLQTKSSPKRAVQPAAAHSTVLHAIEHPGAGYPLQADIQQQVEYSTGADLSGVRVHNDDAANTAARALKARAFTHGSHVWLGERESQSDKRLMAHELTHVVQQNPSIAGIQPIQRKPSDNEQEDIQRETDEGVEKETDKKELATRKEQFGGENRLMARKRELEREIRDAMHDYATAYQYEDLSLDELNELKLEVYRVKREKYLLDFFHINHGLYAISERTIDAIINKISYLSYSEEATLLELEGSVQAGKVGNVVRDTLLDMPELFPQTVVNLYKATEAAFSKKAKQHWLDFLTQVKGLTSKKPGDLIPYFVWMMENSQALEARAGRLRLMVTMIDNVTPVFLERRNKGSTSLGINNLKATLNETQTKWYELAWPNLEKELNFLFPVLENYYFYSLYTGLADKMRLFRIAVEVGYERLNQPGTMPDLRVDIQRAYSSQSPQVPREEMVGGYRTISNAVEEVLDRWVKGLSWWRRIQEGFGLYDVGSETAKALKALYSFWTIVVVVGFVAFLIAVQYVPYANLVVDAILISLTVLTGVNILKFLFIFGSYFDNAADAATFKGLYRTAQGLKGGGATVADLLIDLAALATAGSLKFYARYRKIKAFKDIGDIAEHPVIKQGNSRIKSAFKQAQSKSRTFRGWEESLDSNSRMLLDNSPGLRKILAENRSIRKLLTYCSSPCIIPKGTSENDGIRILAILRKFNIRENTKLWHRMREYLFIKRSSITNAVDDLTALASKKSVQSHLDELIASRARGGDAIVGPGNRWQYARDVDNKVIREYEMGRYGYHSDERGTRSFFNSHHGIQDAWAETRLGAHGYKMRDGIGILLRDRRSSSPHQIVTARQSGRTSGITTRTYAQERKLLLEDMKAAGVPASTAQDLLTQSDLYFGKLYIQLKSSGNVTATELRAIFGGWKP